MSISTPTYECVYTGSETIHHHDYLLAPLLKLMAQHPRTSDTPLRVLDMGCGNGSLTHQFAQAGYTVVGVDDSQSGIAFARETYPTCEFIQGSIYDLPLTLASSFDLVVSVDVIEHLLYPRGLLQAAQKCLKPQGQLILSTPYHGYWKNLALALLDQMDNHYTVLWDGGHIKFFSVKTLTQLLAEEGFAQPQFEFSGRLPYLWKSMLCASRVAN